MPSQSCRLLVALLYFAAMSLVKVSNLSTEAVPVNLVAGGISGSVVVTSGSINVTNLPATQPISGSISVSNLPSTQTVSGIVSVSNLLATQPISGSISVSNLPSTQTVSGIVSVSNTTGNLTFQGQRPLLIDYLRPLTAYGSQTFVGGGVYSWAMTGSLYETLADTFTFSGQFWLKITIIMGVVATGAATVGVILDPQSYTASVAAPGSSSIQLQYTNNSGTMPVVAFASGSMISNADQEQFYELNRTQTWRMRISGVTSGTTTLPFLYTYRLVVNPYTNSSSVRSS